LMTQKMQHCQPLRGNQQDSSQRTIRCDQSRLRAQWEEPREDGEWAGCHFCGSGFLTSLFFLSFWLRRWLNMWLTADFCRLSDKWGEDRWHLGTILPFCADGVCQMDSSTPFIYGMLYLLSNRNREGDRRKDWVLHSGREIVCMSKWVLMDVDTGTRASLFPKTPDCGQTEVSLKIR
jgi:hypothetical protein